jgi:tRNA (guanine-N7-)-methyltransferase
MSHRSGGAVDAGPMTPGGVRPARPHTGLLPDGRRRREVLSYTRRGGRMTDRQAGAWERRREQWWIPDEAVDDPAFELADWFGRSAPLVVEIGSGSGEATATLAAARPECDVLGLEVWRPGVAETFLHLERSGATNVRLLCVDAVWALEHLVGPDSVAELWTFFPDPWPKRRHHRRRLVGPGFARLAARRLAPGARWRLATDWPDYAEQMIGVLEVEPLLTGGPVRRWDERPVTRFERRGIAAGRPATDLCYMRI